MASNVPLTVTSYEGIRLVHIDEKVNNPKLKLKVLARGMILFWSIMYTWLVATGVVVVIGHAVTITVNV